MNITMPSFSRFALRPEAENAPTSGIVDVFNYGRNARGADPAMGRRGRPADAFLHLRGGRTARLPRARPSTPISAASRSSARRSPAITSEALWLPRRPGTLLRHLRGHARRCRWRSAWSPATGDEVLVPTPAWPNFAGAIRVAGARAGKRAAERQFEVAGSSTSIGSRAPSRRAPARSVVNSPANPTGWTASARGSGGHPRPCPPARPMDHRRRDLWPLHLRPGASGREREARRRSGTS